MKKNFLTLLLASTTACMATAQPTVAGYPYRQVPFTSVKLAPGSFFGERLKAVQKVTIPLAFGKCETEHRYENFVKAAHPSDDYVVNKFMQFPFDDTDVYKTIEGASYMLQSFPDKRLEAYIDSVLDIVAKAQETDGYLDTARTMNPRHPHPWAGMKRWEKVEEMLPWHMSRLRGRRSSLISRDGMPIAWCARWVRGQDRRASSPAIRLLRWDSPNFILPQATNAVSTRRSSSSTTAERRP